MPFLVGRRRTRRLRLAGCGRWLSLGLGLFLLGETSWTEPWSAAASEFRPTAPLRYFDTPHFRIIYDRDELEPMAGRVGTLAEEVRAEMLQVLQLDDPGRYDILLLDNYDYSNGSATGYPTRIIRLISTAPSPPIGGSSDLSGSMGETWLRELFVHEYAHALHLNHFTGWTPIFKWLFHSNPFGIIYPGWFIEGLGVAAETGFNQGGRGNTTATDMFLRTAILNNKLLPIGAWGNVSSWPRGGSRYLYGGAFLHYVTERYGTDCIRRILDATNQEVPLLDDLRTEGLADMLSSLGFQSDRLRERRYGGLERGFQRALGIPLSQLLQEWEQSLQARYFVEASRVREAGLSQLTRLTRLGGSTRSPVLSPDGTLVAYVASDDTGLRGVRVSPVEGGRDKSLLLRDDIYGTLSWSPDGEQLLYARLRDENRPLDRLLTYSDLFAFHIRSGRERRLTHGQRLVDPSYSPDGRWIVAVKNGGGRTSLVRIESSGGESLTLFEPDHTYQLSNPMVSPDGKRIAFSVIVQQEKPGRALYLIGVVDRDGGGFQVLPGQGINREAVWVDSNRLLFSSDRSGIFNLYTTDLRDGIVRPVTNSLGGAFQPRIARARGADGAPVVVFRGYDWEGFDVYRLDPNPLELVALLGAGPNRSVPALGTRVETRVTRRPDLLTTPESLGIVPIKPLVAPAESAPYRDRMGLRLSHLQPLTGIDEGKLDSSYDGGLTLGASAQLVEPLDRHTLYIEAMVGVWSGRPTGLLYYRNQRLGFPIDVAIGEDASLTRIRDYVEDRSILAWDRGRQATLGVRLPFTSGRFSSGLSASAAARSYSRFTSWPDTSPLPAEDSPSAYGDPYRHEGWRLNALAQLDLSWSLSSNWRSPAQGHFLALRSRITQDHVLQDARPVPLTPYSSDGRELLGVYTGRVWLGRGPLDLDLVMGARTGASDPFVLGGTSGTFALPGLPVAPEEESLLVSGQAAGLASLSLAQDLWRPELALGQVPWLFLSRVEASGRLGVASAVDRLTATQTVGLAGSATLRGFMFALHPAISVVPSVSVGLDLRTGATSYWFALDGVSGIIPWTASDATRAMQFATRRDLRP